VTRLGGVDRADSGDRRRLVALAKQGACRNDHLNVDLWRFGATGDEKSLYRCRKHGKDINRDGLVDMVCYFKPDVANFQADDRMGKLKGKAKSGPQIVEIEGSAALKIFSVPRERRGFKRRGHHDNDGDHRKNGNDKHRGDDRHKDNDKRKG
jgi:hypothetical protein